MFTKIIKGWSEPFPKYEKPLCDYNYWPLIMNIYAL